MKTIIVHGWVLDNEGNYHEPGSTLTVSAEERAGCIDAERAEQLVDDHSATAQADKADKGKPPAGD